MTGEVNKNKNASSIADAKPQKEGLEMNFFTLRYDKRDDFCAVYDDPDGFDDQFRSAFGLRVGRRFDSSIAYAMATKVSGKVIPDFVNQVVAQLLISQRAAAILQPAVSAEVEFFPVKLLNHRRKSAADLVLVNPIGWYDCLDRVKTVGTPAVDLEACEKATARKKDLPRREYNDDRKPDIEYVFIKRLALCPERKPKDSNLFRILSFVRVPIFGEDLVDAFHKAKLTGGEFIPMG